MAEDTNNNQQPAEQPNQSQGSIVNPLAQPVKRPQPLPPPPPLIEKVRPVNNGLSTTNKLPDSFAVPSEDEIKQEERRLKMATATPPPKPAIQPLTQPTPPSPPPVKLTSTIPAPEKLTVQPPASREENESADIPVPPAVTPPPAPTQTLPPPPPPPAPAKLPAATPPAKQYELPKPDIPLGTEGENRPRRRWPIITAVAVIILGLVWYLQSSGTIYVGFLANFIGGLPKDPAKALTIITNETNTLGNYDYQSSVAVSFSSSLPSLGADTSSVIPDASGTISGQVDDKTAHADFDFVLGANYPVSTLSGVVVIDKQNATFFFDTLSLLQPTNNWRRIARSDADSQALMLPLLQTNLNQLLAKASNGQFLGKSNLNNNQVALTYVYDLGALTNPNDTSISQGRLAVWVSKKDGHILVAQADSIISTSVGDVLLQVQTTPSNYGSSTVQSVDTQAVIDDATVKDIYGELGVIPTTDTDTQSTPGNANDATRNTDLQKIATALKTYKQDFGLYPISRDLVKSTTSGNVLASHLVPDYLGSLPVDPLGAQYYYGYQSDGFSYTLTSILEDGTVEGAKQGNGFYYQEITN